jgi:hypothetical protein
MPQDIGLMLADSLDLQQVDLAVQQMTKILLGEIC